LLILKIQCNTRHQMAGFRLYKIQFCWGSLRHWTLPSGEEVPPPDSLSLDAFGISLSTLSASRLGACTK